MRIVILLFIALSLVACTGKKPSDVLPPGKMQLVLSDLYVAEAYSTMVNDTAHKVRNRNMDSLAVFYRTILDHHHVSPEHLAESIDWYKRNPEDLDSAYVKIIPELSRLQSMYPVH